MADPREILLDLFRAGVDGVRPENLLCRSLALGGDSLWLCGDAIPLAPGKKIHLFGSGKAAAGMARTAARILGDRLAGGLIVTPVPEEVAGLTVLEGSHPVPDAKSIRAGTALRREMERLGSEDFFLYLLSGGSSALIEEPLPPLTLEDIGRTTDLLLASDTDIHSINTVRKHLSAIKGGRLGRVCRASGAVLVLSDVIGDDLEVIGSAPLYRDTSTYPEAKDTLVRSGVWERIPGRVREVIEAGCAGEIPETPDDIPSSLPHYLVGTNRIALEAAARRAESEHHLPAVIMTTRLRGDAREAAGIIMALAEEIHASATPFSPPVCLLFGGETTVRVTGTGRGGRNQELALAALATLSDDGSIALLSGGTDGIDGNSHAAGAVADAAALARSRELGLHIPVFQKNNDTTSFFEQTGSLVVTGPTGTNVMDLVLAVVMR